VIFLEIKIARPEDLRAVAALDSHIPVERLWDCIQNNRVWLLLEGERIDGVLRYSLFWQSIPFLDLLFLEEECRGKGYGRAMMEHWEDAMARQGFSHVMLSTQSDETARYFYEKLGYRCIGSFLPPEQEADELMYLKTL